MKNIINCIFLFVLAGIVCVSGCQSEDLPVPSAPSSETNEEVSPLETVDTSSESEELSDTSEEAFLVTIDSDIASVVFPDRIDFSFSGVADTRIEMIELKYSADKRVLVDEVNTIEVDFDAGSDFDVNWDWAMKKMGLPPGASFWWQWKLTDTEGNTVLTPARSTTFEDTRFLWDTVEFGDVSIFWNGHDERLRNELTVDLETRLSRIELDVTIPKERSIKVFVYKNTEELRDAVLQEQQWAGAIAYPDYNIILTSINDSTLDWSKGALPHEITHLLVAEYTFSPYIDLPTWLNEGLSVYSEGDLDSSFRKIVKEAYTDDRLISIKSLSGSFSADQNQAYLSYAESGSVVAYLIDEYGWVNMRALLDELKNGTMYDEALSTVYGFDTEALQQEWIENSIKYY